MDIEKVVASTRPLTLGDHILLQRITDGDLEATYQYILRRTNLTPEEAWALDTKETLEVLNKITIGVADSLLLESIGNALND